MPHCDLASPLGQESLHIFGAAQGAVLLLSLNICKREIKLWYLKEAKAVRRRQILSKSL